MATGFEVADVRTLTRIPSYVNAMDLVYDQAGVEENLSNASMNAEVWALSQENLQQSSIETAGVRGPFGVRSRQPIHCSLSQGFSTLMRCSP
eukprot:scaffold269_cov404-Prasinococcus_capsulatus_cf.AAC.13